MAIKCKVFEPLFAEHFEEAVAEIYETYQVQYVFPVYMGDNCFSGIAIYDDGVQAEESSEVVETKEVEDNDSNGNTRQARASKSTKSANSK